MLIRSVSVSRLYSLYKNARCGNIGLIDLFGLILYHIFFDLSMIFFKLLKGNKNETKFQCNGNDLFCVFCTR